MLLPPVLLLRAVKRRNNGSLNGCIGQRRKSPAEYRLIRCPLIGYQNVEGSPGCPSDSLVDQRDRRTSLELIAIALAHGGVDVAQIKHTGLRRYHVLM